jgi:hypothetical protein
MLCAIAQNNFFMEKNPTIVNFPVKNLELRDIIPLPDGKVAVLVIHLVTLLLS